MSNKLSPSLHIPAPQIHLTSPDGCEEEEEPRQRPRSARVSSAAPPPLASCLGPESERDLNVCDIIGDWGPYQWSLCLFAFVYSAVTSIVVMFGPILTPDMAHICATGQHTYDSAMATANDSIAQHFGNGNNSSQSMMLASIAIPADRHECFVGADAATTTSAATTTTTSDSLIVDDAQQFIAVKCTSFLYNQLDHGLMLTNGFDLVCDRRWLRSLVSSAALAGMLVSSITLGLFSDKFGRLRCVQVGFAIACLANIVALFARDYFLFCACISIMSFAQVGAANALCTLAMEATSPRLRYVPVWQYTSGWAVGTMLLPLINSLTLDYRLLMGALLGFQLLMLPWLHWGVFESIRWLLSEGHLNRAQIELRRACRMNNIKADTQLAKSIACIEAQQVRKASRIIEHELAPIRLSQALGAGVDETTRELDMLSSAIRRSFFGETDRDGEQPAEQQSAIGSAAPLAEPTNDRRARTKSLAAAGVEGAGPGNKVQPSGDAISLRMQAGSNDHDDDGRGPNQAATSPPQYLNPIESLSPTLSRMSFSLPTGPCPAGPVGAVTQLAGEQLTLNSAATRKISTASAANGRVANGSLNGKLSLSNKNSLPLANINNNYAPSEHDRKSSLTTQGLIQLAMKYSKTVEREDSGQCFILQMLHPKLWRLTVLLIMVSVMLETGYYGLMASNKIVGDSVSLNYVSGAFGDLAASFCSLLLLAFVSRKWSLISCTLFSSLVCLGMALSYQLVPDYPSEGAASDSSQHLYLGSRAIWSTTPLPSLPIENLIDANLRPVSPLSLINDTTPVPITPQTHEQGKLEELLGNQELLSNDAIILSRDQLIQLRQTINFYLMIVGKFMVSAGISIASTISMEAYPNNLRQTSLGSIAFVGRVGSIFAPFLFDDPTPDKQMFKLTLASLGVMGLIVCCLIPVSIRDQKDKELCDQMNEIEG
uniref:Solute carrier family 22 member 5 n=1 Tax=Aceria tosichella TaxID=561515 RepID=A0A6G1SN62_9ACAR